MFYSNHARAARLILTLSLTGLAGIPQAMAGTGKVITDMGGNDYLSRLTILQPDGKIITAGTSNNGGAADFTLARYNPDGSLDGAFGTGGKVITDFGGADYASSLALQADGKIVVAGFTNRDGTNDFAMARFSATGGLDTATFGTAGKVVTDFNGGDDFGASVALNAADGSIVVAGGSYAINGASNFALAKYTSAGVLDTAGFGAGGKVTTDFGGDDFGNGVALQTDNKIVVAGYSGTAGNYDFALARYDAAGALDAAGFGAGGKATTDFGGNLDYGYGVVIQTDNKIVVAGYANNAGHFDFALARYDAAGALDSAGFGVGGKVTTDFGGGATKDDYGTSIALKGDGKILVAGKTNKLGVFDFALARYSSNGALDYTSTTDFGVGEDFGNTVAVLSGASSAADKFVVGGGAAADSALARYNDDGSLDTTFGAVPRLINISTRAQIGSGIPAIAGHDILIGGFVLGGTSSHKVVIRALGPSMSAAFPPPDNALANPTVTLVGPGGLNVTNDNFGTNVQADLDILTANGLTPSNPLESALVQTLPPGAYTALVSGVSNVTGIGMVEIYDVDQANTLSNLINLSSRGYVSTNNKVMIGGFVITGSSAKKVVIRALGPSMAGPPANVPGTLANPSIQLTTVTGTPIASNDDWGTLSASDQAQLAALGLTPTNPNESALVVTLEPNASYTPIVSGVGATSGIALVEVYEVP